LPMPRAAPEMMTVLPFRSYSMGIMAVVSNLWIMFVLRRMVTAPD
jgi:hypothetical protein